MKKLFLIILTILISCKEKNLPRIAIAGFSIESSTFSPAFTYEEDFHAKTGDDIFLLELKNLFFYE